MAFRSAHRDIYCERQRGGSCRLHALNAFFGRQELTEEQFNTYSNEYNRFYADVPLPPAEQWDSVIGTQENLLAFIIRKKLGMGSIYSPPGHTKKTLEKWGAQCMTDLIDPHINRLFVFNMSHVWVCVKTPDGNWKRVDSLQGVHDVNLDAEMAGNKLGFMVVLTKEATLLAQRHISQRIKQCIAKYTSSSGAFGYFTRLDIENFMNKLCLLPDGLAGLEVEVSTFYHMHHILHPHHESKEAFHIFFTQYNKAPNDHQAIAYFMPALIHYICTFDINRQ